MEPEYQRARAKEKGRPSRVLVANRMVWKRKEREVETCIAKKNHNLRKESENDIGNIKKAKPWQ